MTGQVLASPLDAKGQSTGKECQAGLSTVLFVNRPDVLRRPGHFLLFASVLPRASSRKYH